MKAREVKAMEAPGKRATGLGSSAGVGIATVPGMSGGLKRKSGELLAAAIPGTAIEDNEPKLKVAKISEGDIVVSKHRSKVVDKDEGNERNPMPALQQRSQLSVPMHAERERTAFTTSNPEDAVSTNQDGMMDRLKRTVEGLGARTGKSIRKSLGGAAAAAAALAEVKAAKVAAEARIAERDGRMVPSPIQGAVVYISQEGGTRIGPVAPPTARERKLSVSDLVTAYEDGTDTSKKNAEEVATGPQPILASTSSIGDESTSTTPPNSPPSTQTSNSSFVLPPGPVFNKPPVFMPPISAKEASRNLPSTAFALPFAPALDIPTGLPSSSSQITAPPLSAQSTVGSLFSDAVFESQNDTLAWIPNTQDTEYSIAQSNSQPTHKIDDLDNDDSWPMVDEKLAAVNPSWTPFGFTKEDSMTWSTLPTESQRDTRSTQRRTSHSGGLIKDSSTKQIPGMFCMDIDEPNDGGVGDDDLDLSDSRFERVEAGKSVAKLAKVRTFIYLTS
jgi:hypothetical protein